MATEVIIPALGVITEKVKILAWFKSEGDSVQKGEPLLEIEADKVTTEIKSPAAGVLGCILYPEGAEVAITKVAAVIVAEGETVPEVYRRSMEEMTPTGSAMAAASITESEKISEPIRAVPAARKLAEEKGVDLSLLTPTGPHGTIMKKDVEAYLTSRLSEKRSQKVSGLPGEVAEEQQVSKIIPMNKMRQVIARRLSESAFTAPHIYLFIDVNMEKILHLRKSILEAFEKKFTVRLSINDLLIKAVGLAIREYPLFNASVKGNEIHIHPEINVGLAIALDDGLIVPAILQADKLGLGAIAQQRADLVSRARQGKLSASEIERGTFTISSLATYDITFFTAIINPPQSGILSVGRIQDQLFLVKGEVKVRKVSTFGLSADHRIIDGAVAAKFLQTLKKIIENPTLYFLYL